MAARRVTLRIRSPMPFGEVTMVPAPISGRPEAEMARAMAAALSDIEAPSAADVYNRLRQAFPLAPLSARVGALTALMDKIRRPAQ
ncbi:MAG: transferase [Xanthobacteraceae bacterium]